MSPKVRTIKARDVARAVDPPEEIRALRLQLQDAQDRLREYKEEQGTVEVLVREIADRVVAMPPPKVVYVQPKAQKVESPVSLVVHFTDWHAGAVQDADEVEGFNAFSPEILQARLDNFTRDVLNWVALHRATYDVDACAVLVTGDLISGDIHDELRVTNAYPAPVQLVEAADLLACQVSRLSACFREVQVHMITVDNHGRLTKKPQHKQGGYNTFNWPLGVIAQERLKAHRNVLFAVYPREMQVVDVCGWKYLLTHGHNVTGWAGFPYYGISRQVGREAIKRMRRQLGQFDRVILGHWHAPLLHPHYWIGGSASGTDAYDHAQGRESEPCQTAWFVHPKHGEFDHTQWILRE